MKYKWSFRYVKDGLEPDRHGRWALDFYIFVDVLNSVDNYRWVHDSIGERYLATRFCTICQKGCTPDMVPSLVHRFAVSMPSFDDAGNTGFSKGKYYFSNDLEELKDIVVNNFIELKKAFCNIQK